MSRPLSFISSSIAPVLVMLAAACGHSGKSTEAFRLAKEGIGTTPIPGVEPVSPVATGSGDTTDTEPPPPPFMFSCESNPTQQFDSANMKAYRVPQDVKAQVDQALSVMTPAQKASQMLGVTTIGLWTDIQRSVDVDVAGVGVIRGYRYRDAGRGVNLDQPQDNRPKDLKNFSTAFPAPSLRAASWDVDLERRVGAAIGDETVASKNNMLLAPCMNIIRHPYWGRTQETYGEDMYAIGRMATAFTVGIQENVAACAKHYAANNIEKARFFQNALMTEQTLREIYGRHFEMVVQDSGVACIMASYNLVNDEKATQSKHLLRDILKGPLAQGGMNFQGFVITDWWAMPGDKIAQDPGIAESIAIEAVEAGLDVEVPWTLHYSEATLAKANQAQVEDAARRVLTQKFMYNSAKSTDPWGLKTPKSQLVESSVVSEEHELLAEEAAIKSAVLLVNGLDDAPPLLPLSSATNIAVLGLDQPFRQISSSVPKSCGLDDNGVAQGETTLLECTYRHTIDPSLGDRGSSRVNGDPARSYGPFKGIQTAAGASVTVTSGKSAADAAAADTIVVVVGYSPGDEGEEYYIEAGGDRASLNVPDGQNELVQAVLDLDKPTIILIQAGSVVNLPWLDHANKKQATVWAGYPGLRGGLALGKLIFGQASFAGKMPMAWPTEDLLQPFKDGETSTEMGYFFGYRDYDQRKHVGQEAIELIFPFGHGLSYSSFEYANVVAPCTTVPKDAVFEVTVDVKNTSTRDGDEVVFLFVKPPAAPAAITGERPWKELKSFARVSVAAGQTVQAKLPVRIQDLRRWEGGQDGNWVVDSGEYTLLIGKDADDAEAGTLSAKITVNGG